MVEVPAIGPKLILNAFASEVVVDQQKSFDAIHLIEQQRNLGLMKPPLLLTLLRPALLFGSASGDLGIFVEPPYLCLDVFECVDGEGWYFAGFGVLQGDQRL